MTYFKNNYVFIIFILVFFVNNIFAQKKQISKIAFGSCSHQTNDLPIFDAVIKQKPDLFIFLGDNIYGDTEDMQTLQEKYNLLANKPTFKRLKKNVPLIATWDDHDFGKNDAGRHYSQKEASKKIFLDFFDEPKDSERRKRKGIYTSYFYKTEGKILQIIVLDTRTFRDNLKIYNGEFSNKKEFNYTLDYAPYSSKETDSTLLGKTQWTWLEQELKKPADIRIVASSTQFGISYNGYEAWENFPHEKQRFLDLIKKNKANGVIFISGDVHYAELSAQKNQNSYPIYDLTSSGLSSTWDFAAPNTNRIQEPVMENNFGLITIFKEKNDIKISLEILDITQQKRIQKVIDLKEIRN